MKTVLYTIAITLCTCVPSFAGFSGTDDASIGFTGTDKSMAQSVTCAAGAGASSLTITPTESYVEITNSDADGCNITLGESVATFGDKVTMCVTSNAGTTVNFADLSGVSELAGAFTANVDDFITLIYGRTATWREVGRSAN